ncbi:MAG TPA: response regulator [Cyclobacteriaceae bacterium]
MILYKSVFLIDDDIDDRDLFLDALDEIDNNIHCSLAENGKTAIEILLSDIFEKPELIFLDLNMPLINGKELLKELKNSRDLSPIPVIMYSTFFGPDEMDEIINLGASYCLVKHTSFSELKSALRMILSKNW